MKPLLLCLMICAVGCRSKPNPKPVYDIPVAEIENALTAATQHVQARMLPSALRPPLSYLRGVYVRDTLPVENAGAGYIARTIYLRRDWTRSRLWHEAVHAVKEYNKLPDGHDAALNSRVFAWPTD